LGVRQAMRFIKKLIRIENRDVTGGEGGIRTLDRLLTYTHFPGVLLKPLGHLSGDAARVLVVAGRLPPDRGCLGWITMFQGREPVKIQQPRHAFKSLSTEP
jgi:hypothetical protein